MAVTYGYDMKEGMTFVASMKQAGDIFNRFITPELSAMCAAFPFGECLSFDSVTWFLLINGHVAVRVLPAWFPGMGFKYAAAECRRLTFEGLHAPYAWVKRRIVRSKISDHMRVWLIVIQGGRKCSTVHGI